MLIRALREVFGKFSYVVIALVGGLAAFTFVVWLPNFSLIANTLGNWSVPLGIKAQLLAGLFESITTNFSVFSASYTIAIAILFGIDLAMIVYLAKRNLALGQREMTASVGGVISGMFGVGCAACGSFLATSILSLVGAGGAIALLPLKGGEFGLLSVILLASSIYFVAKRISASPVCLP
ncbi:MAG: hypothetical protein KGJ89_03085 [Patescibacteria group bacterium]|nr:hypothetical protein [Patescibacteria group bacterium]MDE2015465.1 hypothetical protein [Patescibacteria group bacterium]MDE2226919.1 hypothetical protein [Patescibacteria group bacterium]